LVSPANFFLVTGSGGTNHPKLKDSAKHQQQRQQQKQQLQNLLPTRPFLPLHLVTPATYYARTYSDVDPDEH
jgi:hypothetical protein